MHCDHRRIRHIFRKRRGPARKHLAFDTMEGRQLLAASITLNSNGVLAIVGDAGADRATVTYAEKTTIDANGLPVTTSDTTTVVARVQCEPSGQAIEKTFAATSVKSVTYSGQGGTDLFVNKTTATSTWSTSNGGVVNTSLMVGSPGYNAPDATVDVGKFRVGSNGKVGIDYLYRGAGYAGQLGIYSLAGMESLKPGSTEYIKEATRRVLSETTQGHVAIRVQNEAAKFTSTTPWEGNFNAGTYKGVHTLTMTPGDTFGAILVPSGTFEQVAANPGGASGSLRPLFSVPAANPYTVTTQLLGQVGDLDGQGSLFAFEDLRLDGSSDRDYNDMVFQVTGARGKATPVSEVYNKDKNFVGTTAFQPIGTYATQKEQADAAAAINALGAGVLKVGSSPSVQVNYLRDDAKTNGEVGLISLQGMEYLKPGSPEFLKEAARLALTDTNLGHIIASDTFEASQSEACSSYHGKKSYGMAAGDSYAVVDVEGGTLFGLYSRNGSTGTSKVRCSVVSANATSSDAASLYSTSPGTASTVTVAFGDTVLDLGGSSCKATDVTAVVKTSRIGATAYLDRNGNGQIDAADPSLGGIAITLSGTDFNGKAVSQTLTSTGHGCVFFENVPAGKYRITSSDRQGTTLIGGSSAGTVGGAAYQGSVSDITILPGDNAANYTLGRVQPGSIRGRVYADDNHDRRYQDGEASIAGVTVALTGTDDLGKSVSLTTKSAADGTYSFAGLRPGTYRLQETQQPTGYLDGRESAGSFVGQAHPIDRNGLVRNDIFSGIALQAGEQGYHYDFGEWSAASAGSSFSKEIALSGTQAADLIIIDANARTLTINGAVTKLDATTATLVSFDKLDANDLVKIVGSASADAFTAAPGASTILSPLLRVELNGNSAVVFQGGAGDRAYLYDSTGNDTYTAAPSFQHLVGPEYDVTTSGQDRVYCYATAGGTDAATLTGSPGDDTFKATPADARLYGAGYYHYVKGFDRVTATSDGKGDDRATLYDSAGDDLYVANPTSSQMSGKDYLLTASGFSRTEGIASAGLDKAILSGSASDDKLFLGPNDNQLVGAGFDLHASGFDSVVGDGGSGGADRAYLTGTQGDDTFTAASGKARLVGPGMDVTAVAFPWVTSNGASCIGHDTAVFLDSADRDVVEAAPYSARMYSTNYQVRAEGFDVLDARSTQGGGDKLIPTQLLAGDDTITASPGQAILTNGAFKLSGNGFGQVEINAVNGGNDKAILTDSAGDDTMTASGKLVNLTSTAGDIKLTGVEQVQVTGTTGKNRKKLDAIDFVLDLLGNWSA